MYVTSYKKYLLLLAVVIMSSCGGKKIITPDKFKTSSVVSKESFETTGKIEELYKHVQTVSENCFHNKTQDIVEEKSKVGIMGVGFGKSKRKLGTLRF